MTTLFYKNPAGFAQTKEADRIFILTIARLANCYFLIKVLFIIFPPCYT